MKSSTRRKNITEELVRKDLEELKDNERAIVKAKREHKLKASEVWEVPVSTKIFCTCGETYEEELEKAVRMGYFEAGHVEDRFGTVQFICRHILNRFNLKLKEEEPTAIAVKRSLKKLEAIKVDKKYWEHIKKKYGLYCDVQICSACGGTGSVSVWAFKPKGKRSLKKRREK